jgi:FAD/FMN-containing dehydrogenase
MTRDGRSRPDGPPPSEPDEPDRLDRRQFFRRGGSTVAALGTAALLGPLAGCSKTTSSAGSTTSTRATATTSSTSTTEPAGGPPDWSTLSAVLSGPLVVAGSPTYPTSRELYNERFDGTAPLAIAYCVSPSDVQRCLAFARRHGVEMAARSGGHSYGGYSSGPGLVIDVTRMATVTADPTGSATIGAGARLIDIYSTLGASGLLLPGGSCPTVGIAGLALGGGIGVFGRKFGLTCDNLRSLEMVTADSRVVTADAGHHDDLLWASKGGGGGNFGVVTSFTFDVHPIPDIALFTLQYPWSAAADVLGAWQHWMPGTPPELWSNCQLLSSGAAGGAQPLEVRVTGVLAGTASTLTGLLGPFTGAVGTAPTYQFVGPESYLRAMLIEAGCSDSSVAACHLPSQNPAGTLSRAGFAAKSNYINAAMPSAGLQSVVEAVASLAQTQPGSGGGMVFDSYGGAINEVAPDSTAFVHRQALACIEYSVSWGPGASAAVMAEAEAWLQDTQAQLAPYSQGAYQNYIDPTLADWQQAYYGSNLPRLVEIKRAYDPDDVFHFAQSIPTSLR